MIDEKTQAVIDAFAETLFIFIQQRNAALMRYAHPQLIELALRESLGRSMDEPDVRRRFEVAAQRFIHEVNDRLVDAGYINNN